MILPIGHHPPPYNIPDIYIYISTRLGGGSPRILAKSGDSTMKIRKSGESTQIPIFSIFIAFLGHFFPKILNFSDKRSKNGP